MRLACSEPLTALKELILGACLSVEELPDVSNFPPLVAVWLRDCKSSVRLTCTGTTAALEKLNLAGCENLRVLPDLCIFVR